VKKINKKSPIFITNNENSKFDLSNFALNNSNMNKNSLNIPNVDTTKSTLLSKETEKKPLPKKVKPHLFNTINYDFFENLINKNINEGRWSSDEHIRFLRAYINFGKKYKLSQKYIGSRNSMQIRSHAQKFFFKLKNLKNERFDFTDDNIKNLLDVFELIKANNKTNIDNKEYIVNTLIELCKNTPKNELNSSKGDIRIIIDKKEGENAFNDLLFNKENSLKTDIFNETFNNKFNIESESSIFEDEEINNDNDMIILNIDRNENENIKQNELDIDRSYEQNRENLKPNKYFGVNEQKYCNKDVNININYNQNLKFDNDYIFVSGDSDIFSKEEIPAKENDFMIVKNNQSPYLKFISNYFS
jgi:SHAQKYF class myb-like DNA-binding protein